MNPADPEDRTVACAEYVLGTLAGAEREQFVRQLADDPTLQAEVGYWQDRLLGLTRVVAPIDPSPAVWRGIEARLEAPGAPVAQPRRQPGRQTSRQRFWDHIAFWRGLSGLALAASLLLVSWQMLRQPETLGTRYVAVLQSPDRQAGWLVEATERGPVKLVPLADPGTIPTGKSWQFWTKGKGAGAPTSLGLLPQGGAVEVPRAALPDLGDEQLFEITLEPEAGSPTGRPTGPILFVGTARRV
jgi:anti-sigma-K factor RskA